MNEKQKSHRAFLVSRRRHWCQDDLKSNAGGGVNWDVIIKYWSIDLDGKDVILIVFHRDSLEKRYKKLHTIVNRDGDDEVKVIGSFKVD